MNRKFAFLESDDESDNCNDESEQASNRITNGDSHSEGVVLLKILGDVKLAGKAKVILERIYPIQCEYCPNISPSYKVAKKHLKKAHQKSCKKLSSLVLQNLLNDTNAANFMSQSCNDTLTKNGDDETFQNVQQFKTNPISPENSNAEIDVVLKIKIEANESLNENQSIGESHDDPKSRGTSVDVNADTHTDWMVSIPTPPQGTINRPNESEEIDSVLNTNAANPVQNAGFESDVPLNIKREATEIDIVDHCQIERTSPDTITKECSVIAISTTESHLESQRQIEDNAEQDKSDKAQETSEKEVQVTDTVVIKGEENQKKTRKWTEKELRLKEELKKEILEEISKASRQNLTRSTSSSDNQSTSRKDEEEPMIQTDVEQIKEGFECPLCYKRPSRYSKLVKHLKKSHNSERFSDLFVEHVLRAKNQITCQKETNDEVEVLQNQESNDNQAIKEKKKTTASEDVNTTEQSCQEGIEVQVPKKNKKKTKRSRLDEERERIIKKAKMDKNHEKANSNKFNEPEVIEISEPSDDTIDVTIVENIKPKQTKEPDLVKLKKQKKRKALKEIEVLYSKIHSNNNDRRNDSSNSIKIQKDFTRELKAEMLLEPKFETVSEIDTL